MWQGVIERYREYLPVSERTPVITLQEGDTPLLPASNLSSFLKTDLKIYLKYEGANPTGSFKDRGMTVAVSKALDVKHDNAPVVICASTGNTSASASAYAARAKIKSVVLIPEGAIALGKLSQALIHGAKVIAIKGNFDDAFRVVKELTSRFDLVMVNSINPFRIEGQKTGAFEICDQLGHCPDYQVMPVGNAGNITAYWKGYKEWYGVKKIKKLPVMLGFQAEGAAPIVLGKIVKKPETIATAIKIGNPASWEKAVEARQESKGLIDSVSDKEIIEAYKLLAETEGVFVEPASASSIAGLRKLIKKNYFPRGKSVVAILTGHGLKDPDRAIAEIAKPVVLPPDIEVIAKEIGLS
ncbi:MAG: threonine synthase [Candidatus Omnitrophica bacterium]|nr:threonine synthase [Candidatus Omnitrophota bacterium]